MNTQSFIAGFFWGWFVTSAAVLGALIYRRMTAPKDGVTDTDGAQQHE